MKSFQELVANFPEEMTYLENGKASEILRVMEQLFPDGRATLIRYPGTVHRDIVIIGYEENPKFIFIKAQGQGPNSKDVYPICLGRLVEYSVNNDGVYIRETSRPFEFAGRTYPSLTEEKIFLKPKQRVN